MPPTRDPRTIPGLTVVISIAGLLGLAWLFATCSFADPDADQAVAAPPLTFANIQLEYFANRQLDTMFVLDTCFLEVQLDSQAVFLHSRSHADRRFPCSTGNIKIHKAIETTEGIFCVQTKSPLAYSRQFDSTKMYFWVGFNGNIGFHGLDGRSYYRFLGKRPSSHGCIRMAREDAEWMFKNIPISTPVIVHKGNAARCLAFIDSVPPDGTRITGEQATRRRAERHLRSWYRGRALIDGLRPFFFQHSNVWWGGIPLGDVEKMPYRQIRPAFSANARTLAERDNAFHRGHGPSM